MRLDVVDRKILAELDKNCRVSNQALGRKVRRSREAVKYRINRLAEEGVITGFITSVNPNKLGYCMFKVYLQLANVPEERQKFYEYLKKQPSTYWFGVSDGAFDCVIAILSKSQVDYYEQINALLSKFQHLIVRKVLGTMVDTHQYNKKFFTSDEEGECVIFGGDTVNTGIDELDKKILLVLVNDARIPLTKLAQKVGSTADTVYTRIKQMEKKGVILGYRISVDLNKLGYEFFKAIIYFKSLSRKSERSLFEWMRSNPNSVYYIRSLAPWDAEFEFVVENYQQFNKIINNLRKRFSDEISHCEHLIMIYETWMPAWITE